MIPPTECAARPWTANPRRAAAAAAAAATAAATPATATSAAPCAPSAPSATATGRGGLARRSVRAVREDGVQRGLEVLLPLMQPREAVGHLRRVEPPLQVGVRVRVRG